MDIDSLEPMLSKVLLEESSEFIKLLDYMKNLKRKQNKIGLERYTYMEKEFYKNDIVFTEIKTDIRNLVKNLNIKINIKNALTPFFVALTIINWEKEMFY